MTDFYIIQKRQIVDYFLYLIKSVFSLHLYDQKTSYFDHKGSFEKQQCFSFKSFNEIYKASVYERSYESSIIPPLKNRLKILAAR